MFAENEVSDYHKGMKKIIDIFVNEQLEYLEPMLASQQARLNELGSFSDLLLTDSKSLSGVYYYANKQGEGREKRKRHYLGSEKNETVQRIKEARFLGASVKRIKFNIIKLKELKDGYQDVDCESIDSSLPEIYRGARLILPEGGCVMTEEVREKCLRWKEDKEAFKGEFNKIHPDPYPEDLRVQAPDGRWVRSKSEVSILILAEANGLINVTELPHKCAGQWIRSDITIISPIDGETEFIIEHEGRMDLPSYQKKHLFNQVKYMQAGYRPNINLFYTYDNLDDTFSLVPVQRIFNIIKGTIN